MGLESVEHTTDQSNISVTEGKALIMSDRKRYPITMYSSLLSLCFFKRRKYSPSTGSTIRFISTRQNEETNKKKKHCEFSFVSVLLFFFKLGGGGGVLLLYCTFLVRAVTTFCIKELVAKKIRSTRKTVALYSY